MYKGYHHTTQYNKHIQKIVVENTVPSIYIENV